MDRRAAAASGESEAFAPLTSDFSSVWSGALERPPSSAPAAPARLPAATPTRSRSSSSTRLGEVAVAAGVQDVTLERARSLLDILGDPGRRAIFERLASSHSDSTGLARAAAMRMPDVLHRIRTLERGGAVRRHPTRVYRADPDAAKSLSTYFDLLSLAWAGANRIGAIR